MKLGLIYPCERCGFRWTENDLCRTCRLGAQFAATADRRKRYARRWKKAA